MQDTTVSAFCPGHISGYFQRIAGNTPAKTGSIGAGIVISEGVTARVSPADRVSVTIRNPGTPGSLSGRSPGSPPIEYVLGKLGVTLRVTTECSLPIGAGFGLSAAALLATLTAANRCLHLGLSSHDIAALAHESEVVHRTGLGDVAACQGGGRVVRAEPGIDGRIERYFDMPEPLFSVSFGPIATPSVLGSPEQMARVAAAFPDRFPADAADFFRLSRGFASRSGLLTPEAEEVIAACSRKDVPASMTMLGNGVFAYGFRAEDILSAFGDVHTFRVAGEGSRLTGVQQ